MTAKTTETPATETATDTAGKAVFETVTLESPIVRGDTTITSLQIRKPKAGELRGGISLSDIIGLDIGTILKLIPRVSEPQLVEHECDNLDPADLTEIGGTLRGFFMTKAERQVLDAMIAEQQPKTA